MTMVVTQMVPSANQPHLKTTAGTTLALRDGDWGRLKYSHCTMCIMHRHHSKTKHMLPLSPHLKMIIFTLPLNDFGHGIKKCI